MLRPGLVQHAARCSAFPTPRVIARDRRAKTDRSLRQRRYAPGFSRSKRMHGSIKCCAHRVLSTNLPPRPISDFVRRSGTSTAQRSCITTHSAVCMDQHASQVAPLAVQVLPFCSGSDGAGRDADWQLGEAALAAHTRSGGAQKRGERARRLRTRAVRTRLRRAPRARTARPANKLARNRHRLPTLALLTPGWLAACAHKLSSYVSFLPMILMGAVPGVEVRARAGVGRHPLPPLPPASAAPTPPAPP